MKYLTPINYSARSNNSHASSSKHFTASKKYDRVFDKKLLPAVKTYYEQQFPGLQINPSKDWVNVKCCFHNDTNPSLSLYTATGGFNCFGCEVTGGDVLAFHQQRYHLSFYEAVSALGAWSHD